MIKPGRLLKSFRYAWRGIATVAREEQNFRVELLAAAAVLLLAAYLRVKPAEAAVLALVCGGVLVLELMNSLLERVVDLVKPRVHPYVAEIKNIAAGAVLVAAATSIAIAVFIFLPYFLGA